MKSEKGITLVTLIITIIVLMIVASIAVASGISAAKTAKDNKLKVELQMVQHAVLEQYHKYRVTKDENVLVGDIVNKAEVLSSYLPGVPENELTQDDYYLLKEEIEEKPGQRKDLSAIGFDLTKEGTKYKEEACYLVSYQTGLVYNVTKKTTSEGEPLYLPETTQAK